MKISYGKMSFKKTAKDLIRESLGRLFGQKSDLDDDVFLNDDYEEQIFVINRAFSFIGMEKWSGIPQIKKEIRNHGGWKKLQQTVPEVDMIAHAERADMIEQDKAKTTDFHKEKEAELKRQLEAERKRQP